MILVLNCGSQSIKWKLFNDDLKLKKEVNKEVFNGSTMLAIKYKEILEKGLKRLDNSKNLSLRSRSLNLCLSGKPLSQKEIKIVGHRVVHGGEKFRNPTKITKRILKEIEKFNNLAPLHNSFNILGIKVASKIFPKAKQIAFFDTGFYEDLPEKAHIYALPEDLRKKYGFRRFGFHGISHKYAAETAAEKIKKPFKKLKIITCHLGGGASITAIKNGKAVDTSMGFTPMEGLVMMTRSGNLDPGIILFLKKKIKDLDYILNQESGIKGICGFSDMREVLKAIKKGNKKAELALELFVYSIQKYIGAFFAVLKGCDLLVFTGAIGFGSSKIRNMICRDLFILKNTKVLAIKTDEELAIAEKIKKYA